MFACLYAHSGPVARLVTVAERFTPRFEVVGSLVMLDVSGLSRLFGSAEEIGAHLYDAAARVSIAHVSISSTQTAAALVALGQPGLTVIADGDEARRLASLPVTVLGELERIGSRESGVGSRQSGAEGSKARHSIPDSRLPTPDSRLSTADSRLPTAEKPMAGWQHPRATHQAGQTRRLARERHTAAEPRQRHSANVAHEQILLEVLRRWGIHTLGALAALPAADVSERVGQFGMRWQRMAMGEDVRPLVPWIADAPFEAALDLEWPIEGLEPLSFVLTRLFEPLIARLERADRGAASIETTLRLVTRTTHVRTLQLPAPMRDTKTLRALVLLDLESHPPAAAVDRVQIVIEPTPARVLQWELFARAQPSPEQVSTLLARLTALAGDGHVGSPRLLDSWKPGAFEMSEFRVTDVRASKAPIPSSPPLHAALRRFRLPVPARVTVRDGRPVRVQSDRHGVPSGAVMHAAGPWRTSGQWWDLATPASSAPSASAGQHHHGAQGPWDRDEWDVELAGGLVYRIFVEREIGQWFIEGSVD
jgi:protein ImuB